MGGHFAKTAFIVLPALFLILFLSSAIAFACTRYSWRFNVFFLILFTAGNLMPQQVIFQPLFQIYKRVPCPDFLSDTDTGTLLGTKLGVILIHVAFQIGFCTFVLSNYMKTIPKELSEAAAVDGACVPRQYFQVILPLSRPALAALATLEFTWLYNDFFWGAVLLNQGGERPITSSIAVLNGQYAQRLQPDRGSVDHDRPADADRVPDPAEAVHLRTHARRQQGVTAVHLRGGRHRRRRRPRPRRAGDRPLGPPLADASSAIGRALELPVVSGSLDVVAADVGRARARQRLRRPARVCSAHRADGRHWAPRFRPAGHDQESDSRIVVRCRGRVAGLALEVTIELADALVVRASLDEPWR